MIVTGYLKNFQHVIVAYTLYTSIKAKTKNNETSTKYMHWPFDHNYTGTLISPNKYNSVGSLYLSLLVLPQLLWVRGDNWPDAHIIIKNLQWNCLDESNIAVRSSLFLFYQGDLDLLFHAYGAYKSGLFLVDCHLYVL